MKHNAFFCAVFAVFPLVPLYPSDNLDLSAAFRYADDGFSVAFLNDFPHLESDARKWKNSIAVSMDFGNVDIAFGNLTKSGSLSKFNYPVPSAFSGSSVASALTPYTMGAKAAFPSAAGNYPHALSVSAALPKKMSVEFFTFDKSGGQSGDQFGSKQTYLGQIFIPLEIFYKKSSLKKTTLNCNFSVFDYVLTPDSAECEKSWFLKKPNFAEQRCTSFLLESQLRTRDIKDFSPALLYFAAGLSESPFGGYNFWLRNEGSVTIKKIFTLKERFFFAPADFYTAESRLVPARYSYSLNPLFFIGSASLGAALSYDSSTDLYAVKTALKTAFQKNAHAFGLNFAGGFDNFNRAQFSSAVIWAEAGVATHSRYVNADATLKYKYFLAQTDGAVSKGKDAYTVLFNVSPEANIAKRLCAIPSLHLGADFTTKNGKLKYSIENTLRWKIATDKATMNFGIKYVHGASAH
ncbi:MAG: hypothetical protein Ta2A_06570 [Treponemataceae bacterium]|nr:MAG: hypothetical protein Ta2A_06570 [Treponemataceae bacterium]